MGTGTWLSHRWDTPGTELELGFVTCPCGFLSARDKIPPQQPQNVREGSFPCPSPSTSRDGNLQDGKGGRRKSRELPPPAGLRRRRQVRGAVGRAVNVRGALRTTRGQPGGGGGLPNPSGRELGTRGTRDKGYLADIAAQGGHHPAGVPLHPLHQPVVPSAACGIQRRRALGRAGAA